MTEVKKIAPSLIEMAKEVIRLDSAPLNSSWEEFAETACNAAPALAAALLRAEELLDTAHSWLDRWGHHAGNCRGDERCTCGLVAVRSELSSALASLKEPQQ